MFEIIVPSYRSVWRPWSNIFDYDFLPSFYTDACEYEEWAPVADITETDKHFMITMELPGIDMSKTDISYKDGELVVKGEKIITTAESDTCVCSERFSGPFSRRFLIDGKVDAEKIEATYKDGVLNVTLPKSAESMPKKIEVH